MRIAAVIATIGIAISVFDSTPSLAASGQFGERLSATDMQLYRKAFAAADGQLIEDGMAIGGDPDAICRQVDKWASAGLDQLIFVVQAGKLTHEQAMSSIELIGTDVIPRFQ